MTNTISTMEMPSVEELINSAAEETCRRWKDLLVKVHATMEARKDRKAVLIEIAA